MPDESARLSPFTFYAFSLATSAGGKAQSLVFLLMLVVAMGVSTAVAAPVQLDCLYPRMADPEHGLRDARDPLAFRFTIDREANTATMLSGEFVADLELRFSQRHLTLFQTTGNEGLNVTVIVFEAFDESDLYRSVHSRHAMIGSLGELKPSQYYGRCAPVFADDE